MIEEYTNIDQVLNIDTSEPVDLKIGENEETMTLYTAARWLALVNALETINEKAEQIGMDLEKEKGWVKPLAIQKFIDEQTPSCIAQVKTLKQEKE